MRVKSLFLIIISVCILSLLSKVSPADTTPTEAPHFSCTLRMGQGGFQDDRSPLGKLGGGQTALDFRPGHGSVALSFSSEYYTNSPDASHPYEIAGMTVVSLLYMTQLFHFKRATFFAGGGLGRLEVPKNEDTPDERILGTVYNLEAGINVRVFWKIGVYGVGKFLYAQKKTDGVSLIDFQELAALLGLTLNIDF